MAIPNGVLRINNDFWLALADTFESVFSGNTTAKVGSQSGQSSYQSVLSNAYADDPDFIAFAGYPENGTTLLSQWDEEGYGGNWVLHTSLLSEEVVENVGADLTNGMFGVGAKPPTGEATESFVSDTVDVEGVDGEFKNQRTVPASDPVRARVAGRVRAASGRWR